MDKLDVYLGPDKEWTFLPYHLPAGKAGRCEVTREVYKQGRKVTIVSIRNAFFMGLKRHSAILDRDVVVHWLIERDSRGRPRHAWMSSQPQEIEQATRQLARAHGNVLVGGLGLGLAVIILSGNRNVKSITVVEKSAAVIKLVWLHLPQIKARIVHADLFKWVGRLQRKRGIYGPAFDFAFYDVWTPTWQSTHAEKVLPLRRLSLGVVPQNNIECWNEDEMLGQTRLSLDTRLLIEYDILPKCDKLKIGTLSSEQFLEGKQVSPDMWPFLNWLREAKPTLKEAREGMEYYMKALKDADLWESRWGAYEQLRS